MNIDDAEGPDNNDGDIDDDGDEAAAEEDEEEDDPLLKTCSVLGAKDEGQS